MDPEVERAREHVSRCSACTLYLAQDRIVLGAFRELASVRAPLRVRARVYEAVANADGGPGERVEPTEGESPRVVGGRPSRRWVGAAVLGGVVIAGVLMVLVSGLADRFGPSGRGAAPEEQAYVEDYLRRAVSEDFLESSDPDVIARFLHRELGLRSRLLRTPGLVPSRVEICLLEGHRGAMVVYHHDDRSVTHYLVPREGPLRPPRVAEDRGGLSVVIWSSGTTEEALVGEVPSEELLSIARANGAE